MVLGNYFYSKKLIGNLRSFIFFVFSLSMKRLETKLCFISAKVSEVIFIMNLYRFSFQKYEKLGNKVGRLQNLCKLLSVSHKRVLLDIHYLLISYLLVLES